MSNIQKWANFFEHEKLHRDKVMPMKLLLLAEELAKLGTPIFRPYTARLQTRILLVNKAMDLGIDLTEIRMGRGLLDIWNQEYTRRYGSIIGTKGWKEDNRRKAKSKVIGELKDGISNDFGDTVQSSPSDYQ